MLAGIGYWDYDSDSRSFTFSPEASRILFGCEKETVASFNDYTSMILKEFRQDYVKQFAKKHKQTYRSQKYSLKTRDSRTRNIHEIRIDNFSSDGDYLSSRGVLQDITRLESINEALKQSEARLTSAVAGVKLGIWEYDHSTNIFKTNKTWFSMLEYDTMEKPEISRNAWENLLHPDDRNAVVKFFEKFIRRDVPVYDTKYRMRSNDGHYKWIHSFARRTGDPEEKTIIGFHLDVSESITQYQNLELINTLVETTQDAFYIVDSKGCIRFANKAACSMLKYDIKSLLSMHIQDLDMQKKIKSTKGYTDLWKSRKPGIQYSFRTRHKTSDGKTIPVEAHLVHRKINNEMLSFSIVSDITDRLKEEKELIHARKEAESANIAKSRFISGISHEIRTPLNAIIGYSNLLSDELKDPDYIDYVKSIYMAGKNLLALINNVLDLSKIEADKIKLSRKPVQIIELLQELETIFRIKTEKKGLDFILDTPRNAPYLHLDKVRMQQVITNLIENAIKFTSEGYIKVTLQFRQVLGLPCTVMISVRDTGIGIPAKNIKKIFNSFEQSDNGVELSHSGSGLGLAISKQLTEMMGGTLNCKSIVGKGSIFTVTLNGVKSFNYKGSLGMEEIEPNSHEIINFANKKKSDSLKLPKNISTADRDSLKNLICQLDSGISVSQGHALSVKLKKLGQIYDSSSLTKTSEKLTSALNTFDMVQIEKIIKICNKAIF